MLGDDLLAYRSERIQPDVQCAVGELYAGALKLQQKFAGEVQPRRWRGSRSLDASINSLVAFRIVQRLGDVAKDG